MKTPAKEKSAWAFVWTVLFIWVAVGTVLVMSSCTIAPKPVTAPVASYSGNDANGGFIGYLPDGSGHITAHAYARYSALLASGYAKGLIIPVPSAHDGVACLPDGSWSIDREHLTLFAQMAHAFDSGVKP